MPLHWDKCIRKQRNWWINDISSIEMSRITGDTRLIKGTELEYWSKLVYKWAT